MRKGIAVVDVPLEGVTVLLSFGTGSNGFLKTFDLTGETLRVPFVKLASGLIMIDLEEQIGHGVPSEMLEELGCMVTLEPDPVLQATPGTPGGRKDKQYYFA